MPRTLAEQAAHDVANADAKAEPDLSNALSFDQDTVDRIAAFGSHLETVGGDLPSALGQFLTNPTKLPDSVALLSEQRGIDPAESQEYLQHLASKVDEALGDYLITQANVSPEQIDAFWQYVKDSHGSKYVPVINEAVFMGNASGLKQLAEAFRTAHGAGMGAAREDMVETVLKQGREIKYVTIDGQRMTLEGARRAGLL